MLDYLITNQNLSLISKSNKRTFLFALTRPVTNAY